MTETPLQTKILEEYYKDTDFSFQDQEKYEKQWVPKIQAYVAKLEQAQPAELKFPSEVKKDEVIDAIKFILESKVLTEREIEITETKSCVKILKLIHTGKWTSVEVYKAFAHRMILANQLSNFALEIFLDEGLTRAQSLDDYYAQHGKPIGPLHGLPISIKETNTWKDRVTHCGYVSMIEHISERTAPALLMLEKLGCVFYVRTSEPQTIMHLDTDNNIIGRTRNPYNLNLSAGGSSGGEAACVAIGGSPMGLGADIGGSLRAPANCCGCYSFKPTSRRIPINYGAIGSGNESIVVSYGPFTRDADDLDLFMDMMINVGDPSKLDPWSIPLPWRKLSPPPVGTAAPLKIGVIWDDGIVRPSPPILRGLQHVVSKLKQQKQQSVELVDFIPPRARDCYDTANKLYSIFGCQERIDLLAKSGEPLLPLSKWYLTFGSGTKKATVEEFASYVKTRDTLRELYHDAMTEQNLDLILCPLSCNVASLPHKAYYWGYTTMWNLLDMPASAFPTGLKQDPVVDSVASRPLTARNQLEELEFENYYTDPKVFTNAPICLQLVGRRYQDEEVVAGTRYIANILKV